MVLIDDFLNYLSREIKFPCSSTEHNFSLTILVIADIVLSLHIHYMLSDLAILLLVQLILRGS